jgi:ribonuclease BN (tRNA processing enzyme)
MRIQVLGSSGGYPVPGNPSTGFLLEADAGRLWLDAGGGTFAALQEIDPKILAALDALVLSHVHQDHCLDLLPLSIALRYGTPRPRETPLPVLAPPGLADAFTRFLGPEDAGKMLPAFAFETVEEGDEREVGGLRLRFLRTQHPAHTLAVRLEDGATTLTYSADAGPETDLAPFAEGSDLLLCEASYQEGRMGAPVHLSARQAGTIARHAGVRRLVLTHVWPGLDPVVSVAEATEAAGGVAVRWAAPRAVFEI